jgi:putative PIN family toxin of toxin-antitoxin system
VRVVLDTNLLISALISKQGAPALLIDAWDTDHFTLISSAEQLQEFKTVSRRERLAPFIQRSDAGRFVNQLQAEALILKSLPQVDRSIDPADNFLLAMAEAGEADYLVSGDRRGVLALVQHGRTQIVTARSMIETLGLEGTQSGQRTRKGFD